MSEEIEIIKIIENHKVDELKEWLEKGGDPNFCSGLTKDKPSLIQHVLFGIGEPETEQLVIKMLQLLIDKGADVNKCSEDAYPILCAVSEERSQIVKILLEANANIDVIDKFGDTPLTSAVIDENVEIVELLVKYADKDSIDRVGSIWVKTPLGIALFKLNLPIIELLLKYGADPYIIDFDNGNVPMIENIHEDADPAVKEQILSLVNKYYQPVEAFVK